MTEQARVAAAAALRALNNAFVAHDADVDILARITAFADESVTQLRSAPQRDRVSLLEAHVGRMFRVDSRRRSQQGEGNPMTDRAVGGETNPISAEFDVQYVDNEVVARTVLGAAYEGAPGRAHGGMVAAVFDDITGCLLPLAGTPAYTGQLTVRYHRPVPVATALEFRTRIAGHEGRKLYVTAECKVGEEVVASADAVFITVETHRFGRSPGSTDGST